MDWVKTTARRDEKHLSFGIWCTYIRYLTIYIHYQDCSSLLLALQWCHDEHDGFSNHRCLDCLCQHRTEKTSKLCITGLHEANQPVTGGFPSQRASNMENVSIWWCHHVSICLFKFSDVTWVSWCLKTLAFQVFVHQLFLLDKKGSMNAAHYWSILRGQRWIPLTKGQ